MDKSKIASIAKRVLAKELSAKNDKDKIKALAEEFKKMKNFKESKLSVTERLGDSDDIYLYFNYVDDKGKKDVEEIDISILDNKVYWDDFSRHDLLGTLDNPKQCRTALEKAFAKIDGEKSQKMTWKK